MMLLSEWDIIKVMVSGGVMQNLIVFFTIELCSYKY